MPPLRRLARPFRSARTWIALGVLAPVGMLAVSGLMLLDLRQDAWDKAEQTSKNLLQVLERDIARNVEMYDLSIRGAVDNLRAPGLAEVGPRAAPAHPVRSRGYGPRHGRDARDRRAR